MQQEPDVWDGLDVAVQHQPLTLEGCERKEIYFLFCSFCSIFLWDKLQTSINPVWGIKANYAATTFTFHSADAQEKAHARV